MNLKSTKKKNQVITANIFEQQELLKKAEVIRENLKASTWHELETNGKFDKNEKLSFISDDMLILGCDVGSETHYVRAIDTRGRELSKSAFSFNNDSEGFQSAKEWAVKIAAEHNKNQIVLGLEPTGHYWFCLATWMVSNGISVVQVNPYAVKQTKEVEDNSQLKDDTKDPKLIANLVKDGNFGMPYLPEKLYGELRRLSMFRDQLNEDRIRSINRMHREMKIYFPEYKDALGKVDGAFSLELLKQAPFPDDLKALDEDGIRQIWHEAKLRGRGYSRSGEILGYARSSVGIKDGADAAKMAVQWFVKKIMELDEELAVIENLINQKCKEMSPQERFFQEPELISRLPDEQIDSSFLLEIERRVSADSVIVIDQVEYEVDYRFAKQRITLRYTPDMKDIFIVEADGSLTPIRLLNKHDNASVKRDKVRLAGGED